MKMVMVRLIHRDSSTELTYRVLQCANTAFNPDPNKVSFSCRISAGLRGLPEAERRES